MTIEGGHLPEVVMAAEGPRRQSTAGKEERKQSLGHVKALFKPYGGDKFGGNGGDTTEGLM